MPQLKKGRRMIHDLDLVLFICVTVVKVCIVTTVRHVCHHVVKKKTIKKPLAK